MGTPAKFRLGRSSHTGRVSAGRVEVRLRCVRSLGQLGGICHPPAAGHTSKTGEARLDLSRLVLTHAANALHPTYPVTLSPCPPACLPTQDLPVGWPRSSFSIHSITIPTPSRSRLNPIPSQGPQAADCTFIALRPAADTPSSPAIERALRDILDHPRFALRLCPNSARPMAS